MVLGWSLSRPGMGLQWDVVDLFLSDDWWPHGSQPRVERPITRLLR